MVGTRVHSDRPAPGTPLIVQWRKWDGSPHWRHECVYLGADEWGDWVGQTIGWGSARPGKVLNVTGPSVTLIPRCAEGAAGTVGAEGASSVAGALFALTVNRSHPKGMRVYIDLGWEICWAQDPLLVTGIDMDLDVVRVERRSHSLTTVEDRDEWAEHADRFGYPADVMERLEALALDLEVRVRAGVPPFDSRSADVWLDRVEELGIER